MNLEINEVMFDLGDIVTDLHEVVLVVENQFVNVNVAQIKEYEKDLERCKLYEEKIKEYETIVIEMEQKQKQAQSVSQTISLHLT